MIKNSENNGTFPIFMLGAAWGLLWVLEILSFPAWYFIGINALLIGAGILAARKIPYSWERWAPALLVMLAFALPLSDLRSVLLPFVFGLWYGGENAVFGDWKTSRVFCGGLLLGGIFAGIGQYLPFWSDVRPFFIPVLVALVLINSVGNEAWYSKLGMTALSALFIWFSWPSAAPAVREEMHTGTVLSALALVKSSENGEPAPKISFIGNRNTIYYRVLEELFLDTICNVSCSELPGTISPGTNLIIVTDLPENGDRGMSVLRRELTQGAVLVMPSDYWQFFPGVKWHILPGSNGKYAALSFAENLKLDPDAMDQQLAKHFRNVKGMSFVPLPGAFAGMLIDFEAVTVTINLPPEKNFFNLLIFGALAFGVLLVIWIIKAKVPGIDSFRVILNCAGYTMLAGVLLPVIFKALPSGEHFRALLVAMTLIWIFRRPVPNFRKRFWISGTISALLLLFAYFRNIYVVALALVSGGYFFATLDGELCRDRDGETEALRFLGFAVGAFASWGFLVHEIDFSICFLSVAALRLWSWIRG